MEIFEIHITGDSPKIHSVGKTLGIKTIEIDLLTPKGDFLRTEHMTSFIRKHSSLAYALPEMEQVASLIKEHGVNVLRMKLECPPYKHYAPNSVYMETHFKSDSFLFPTSRSKHSGKLLATARTFDTEKYNTFTNIFSRDGFELELCMYDSYVAQDVDWLNLWNYQ